MSCRQHWFLANLRFIESDEQLLDFICDAKMPFISLNISVMVVDSLQQVIINAPIHCTEVFSIYSQSQDNFFLTFN